MTSCPGTFQLSFEAITVPVASANCSTGSLSAPVTPSAAREGPIARNATFLATTPSMIKPPIKTSLPTPTWVRLEILARAEGGIGVGEPAV